MSRSGGGTPSPGKFILGGVVVLGVIYFAFGFRAWMEKQATLDRIEELRGVVFEARNRADGCASSLALDESMLRQTDARLDSLRAAVEGAEEPLPGGGRGVDAEEYEAYMEDFNAYNDGVERWEAQARSVRDREEECRQLVLRHNVLVDSLRTLLRDSGFPVDEPGATRG